MQFLPAVLSGREKEAERRYHPAPNAGSDSNHSDLQSTSTNTSHDDANSINAPTINVSAASAGHTAAAALQKPVEACLLSVFLPYIYGMPETAENRLYDNKMFGYTVGLCIACTVFH